MTLFDDSPPQGVVSARLPLLRASGASGAELNYRTCGDLAVTSLTSHRAAAAKRTDDATPIDAAARMLSETAHDLRSPLTTVRESMRLVHDGDLGEVNRDQRECLADAMNQCNCIDQMVGEMLQLDRLRHGLPRVHRDWIAVSEIRQSIDEALRPWALPRQITVMWDGADDPNMVVFADPLSLRRMIVNLVSNAIRVTPEGGRVLVNLQRLSGGEAVRWSVIDQGTGISEADMRQIASQQFSNSGSEGLGLMICRQLAAVHFSLLNIRSRVGCGTEVSFQTAAGGPSSVASSWFRWRNRIANSDQSQSLDHSLIIQQGTSLIRPPRRARIDPPAVAIEISCDGESPRSGEYVAVGTIALGAAMSRQAADEFDAVLQNQMRLFELAYRVDSRRWVWIFDANEDSVAERIESVTDAVSKQIEGVRMNWSGAQVLPLNQRRSVAMLSDLLVRNTLCGSSSSTIRDNNEVRLGTAPITATKIAAARLDEELRRLSSQLKGQTSILRQQARNLRPLH